MWLVGRTDGKNLPEQGCKERAFDTEMEAIEFLHDVINKIDPDGVRRGQYYVEPEHNPD